MEVREGMSKVVLTLGPGHTLREAARMMTEKGVGAAVVLDEEAPGPSILSERDVLTSLGKGEDPDSERAATEMARRGIRHLVIVEGGELSGVLSMRDIMRVWTSEGATSAMTSG